ncbi:MAG: HlyD family efflux transporter periplasmic adaptor subunit [Pseudomonadota bacterium]
MSAASGRRTETDDEGRRVTNLERLTARSGVEAPTHGIRDTSAQDRSVPNAARRRSSRWWLRVGLALVVLAVIGWLATPYLTAYFGAPTSVSEARLRLAQVERGRFVRDVGAEGIVVAAVSPTLFAPEDGTVTFAVQEGDAVRAGDAVATIDSPELRSLLEQESATLRSLETGRARRALENRAADLANQQQVDLARVTVVAAERELRRAESSRASQVISQQDYEKAIDDLERAKLEYAHAQQNASLESERSAFDLKTLEIERDRQALVVAELQRRIDDLVVPSPVDGIVGALTVTQKAAVARNAPVLTVVDLSALEVEIRVPQSFGDDLAIGLPAEVTFSGTRYGATLTAVSPQVQDNQVVGRIRFDGELPPRLRQNQRVAARVFLESSEDALKVRRGPFMDAGGGRVAYVVEDRVLRRRSIRTGSSNLREVEILEGLSPGDTVVISDISIFAGAESVMLAR